jgi:hypothetical protein
MVKNSFCFLVCEIRRNLSNNGLSGQIPQCWQSLGNLVTLDLSNNSFSGSFEPSFFLNWSRLQYLYVFGLTLKRPRSPLRSYSIFCIRWYLIKITMTNHVPVQSEINACDNMYIVIYHNSYT